MLEARQLQGMSATRISEFISVRECMRANEIISAAAVASIAIRV